MNYLVTYKSAKGKIKTIKTFTFFEAYEIINYSLKNNCTNASIKPLNNEANEELMVMMELDKELEEKDRIFN